MQNIQLQEKAPMLAANQPIIKKLNLSNNSIQSFSSNTLFNLIELDLTNNPIGEMNNNSLPVLTSLHCPNSVKTFTNNNMTVLEDSSFFRNLPLTAFSGNTLPKIT